ncbi:hypothetical protein [Streptomyces hygroscopicus]|uniref:hypothetical protein n=1 Tax=Streptomyces hygroscopicus TaxID=1912 RepID=UPI0007678CDD|nr:hypothetical protein [Streptomyces hygroscopicus]GLV73587.1 hypothetical protein Shyhy02_15890 [Streptomyces hygroscopicus subsp. hygroscopicus]
MQKKQMMVLGAIVVGVLWINNHGDGNTKDGDSPSSDQKDRYPVHFQSEKEGKKDKTEGKGDKKHPEPRSTVSYPIKFDHR